MTVVTFFHCTLSFAPTQTPQRQHFYDGIGKKGSEVNWNRQNIQQVLRHSDTLFEVANKELSKLIRDHGLCCGWGLRGGICEAKTNKMEKKPSSRLWSRN